MKYQQLIGGMAYNTVQYNYKLAAFNRNNWVTTYMYCSRRNHVMVTQIKQTYKERVDKLQPNGLKGKIYFFFIYLFIKTFLLCCKISRHETY